MPLIKPSRSTSQLHLHFPRHLQRFCSLPVCIADRDDCVLFRWMFSEITLGPSFFHSPPIVLEDPSVVSPSVLDAVQPLPFLHTVLAQTSPLITPSRCIFSAAYLAASRFVLFHLCLDFANLILNNFCCRCLSLKFASRCAFFQQVQHSHFVLVPMLNGNIQYSSASIPQTSHVLFKPYHLHRNDLRYHPIRHSSHNRECT